MSSLQHHAVKCTFVSFTLSALSTCLRLPHIGEPIGHFPDEFSQVMTSLDHAFWMQPGDFDLDSGWNLYEVSVVASAGGRGLATGRIFDARGRFVAASAQEGLIRVTQETSPSPTWEA